MSSIRAKWAENFDPATEIFTIPAQPTDDAERTPARMAPSDDETDPEPNAVLGRE